MKTYKHDTQILKILLTYCVYMIISYLKKNLSYYLRGKIWCLEEIKKHIVFKSSK